MGPLDEIRVGCPYCGAGFVSLVDASIVDQQYIEDCRACCQPINFTVTVDNESRQLQIRTLRDDE